MLLLHLVPVGRGRLELYGEPPESDETPPSADAGRVRQWLHTAGDQWRRIVDRARMHSGDGRFARWRDTIVCRLADSIEEQRTLWALRTAIAATVLYPRNLQPAAASAALDAIVATSQRHHGKWLIVDLMLFIASGVLFFVPGPNIVAYYLGFRTFGHLQSWRGARQAASKVQWTMVPSDELAELAMLAEQPHARRAGRVEDIARKLDLPRLPAFFERAAL